MTIRVFCLAFFLLSLNAWSSCPEEHQWIEGVRVSQGEFKQTQTCYLSVGPRNTRGLVYRNYLFTSRGLMMSFSSFGDGPSSTHTGSSELIFFPLLQNPSFRVESDELIVTMANGSEVVFDIHKGVPLELSGGELSVRAVQRGDVRRGVHLLRYSGLVLDLGFQVGMSPSWYLNRASTFKDADGFECQIQNSEFFVKKDDETYYRYPNDERIEAFLKKRCPELTWPVY